jgi:hypothetical protein
MGDYTDVVYHITVNSNQYLPIQYNTLGVSESHPSCLGYQVAMSSE